MQREATAIRRIHVSEQGRFGVARIDAAEQGLDALGYVLPNRVIGAALWEGLRRVTGVETFAPARVTATGLANDRRTLRIERGGEALEIEARLVVAADGARSIIREQAGVAAEHWEYGQTAIIATLTTQRFHDHVAYERFTPDGPIAVLPLADGRCGIVWTRRPEEAAAAPRAARRGVPRRTAGRLRLPPRAAAARRHPVFLSARAVALGASRGAAARHRRQCRTVAASDRRTGLQSRAARRGEPRRSDRGRAGGRPDRRRRRGHAARLRQLARRGPRSASSPSRTGWCACSDRRSARCGACAAWACWPSTPSRLPRLRWHA